MPLALRDSLTGERRAIGEGTRRPVTLYVCGPTVYDAAHVGHGRTYLYFDLIRRILAEEGAKVRHVMNITDVEDKIADRAAKLRIPWRELARREERRFNADLTALRVLPPTYQPRASTYVPKMVEVARRLAKTGRVHSTGDGWVYRPDPAHADENFAIGAELARHAVPEPGHPFDSPEGGAASFLVWKPQEPPLPSFASPWGRGVPGWHLECYTMAHRLLGLPVDVHGGGMDLVFPHHYAENEVALTLDREPFARTFVHTAFVTENGTKMSKSLGNLVPLRPVIDDVGPDALRWYLLGLPYTARLGWSSLGLERAESEWGHVRELIAGALTGTDGGVSAARFEAVAAQVQATLEDGLRANDALTTLRTFALDLAAARRAGVERGGRPRAKAAVGRIGRLLGLELL